jgi:putative nucleotidyltransferase with HDIG domain
MAESHDILRIHIERPGAPRLADLAERMANLFASPDYVPPMLPTVAIELLDLNRYVDIDLKRIASHVAMDPILAGRVMRLVQSPIYSGRADIRNLNQAVTRIGLNALRDLVLQAALNLRLFSTPGYSTTMERVRRHSVATAHIARIIARHTGQDPEEAFLCGLLHDVGIAAALIVVDEMYADGPRPQVAAIWPAIEAVHESTGLLLARIWKLPKYLANVIGSHHDFTATGRPNDRIATLHLAERLAAKLGRGIITTSAENGSRSLVDITPQRLIAAARVSLDLSHTQLRVILVESQETLDAIH